MSRTIGTAPEAICIDQDLARANRRQLVDIPDHQQGGFIRRRLEQRIHQ
jgi:hypothetical protein